MALWLCLESIARHCNRLNTLSFIYIDDSDSKTHRGGSYVTPNRSFIDDRAR
jgi:hypothetical protein